MEYKVKVPPTVEMGSYVAVVCDSQQTVAKEALDNYNYMREHDGLPPISRMPNGTEYIPLKAGRVDMKRDKSLPVVSIVKQRY